MAMDQETKKRTRDQFDGTGMVFGTDTINGNKRARVDDQEEYFSSPDLSQFEETILSDILEEPEALYGLDMVIRSFEEEIMAPSGHQPEDLGYLLVASDDELGLPPTSGYSSGDDEWGFSGASWADDTASFDIGGVFGLEYDFIGYDHEFAACADGYEAVFGKKDGQFVAEDGLFDCAVAGAVGEWELYD